MARRKLEKDLKTDMYYWGREWPYKNVERKIIAEQFMEEVVDELSDYKLINLDETARHSQTSKKIVTINGLKITLSKTTLKERPYEDYCLDSKLINKNPLGVDKIIELTKQLALHFPISQVDFLEFEEKKFFGVVTLNSNSKLAEFTPSNAQRTLGTWVKLPGKILMIKENVIICFPAKCSKDLTDYKFFCFNGKPLYCQVISGRSTNKRIDFYDMNWKLQPFVGLSPRVTNSGFSFPMPENFEKMKSIAMKLSSNTPFSRIDFYEINHRLYFGEFTLYPASGFGKFSPEDWNKKLGDMITLT